MMNWEQYVVKVLSICKIGLKYSIDLYARENYETLQSLSASLLNELPIRPISDNFYERDIYPTPNISVRVIVLDADQRLLMVKETAEGKWAVPGGWVDIFETVKEAAIKEVKQESGLDIEIVRLLAVLQRERYKDYPTLVSEVVHYFYAHVTGGQLTPSHETEEVAWFDLNHLPDLSKKTTKEEIDRALSVLFEDKYADVD